MKLMGFKEWKEQEYLDESTLTVKKVSSDKRVVSVNDQANDREFEIQGTSKDDYYSVYGATTNEIKQYQYK